MTHFNNDQQKNKNYVILTPSVGNLGGAQLYVLRRANYLINIGFDVKIIVSQHNSENFILEEKFEKIPILYLDQLVKPVSFCSKDNIDSIIKAIRLFLKTYINGIIETSSVHTAIWGELIADRLNLKHIVYLLSEQPAYNYSYYPGFNFFEYKLNRSELFATTDQSLSLIFGRQINNNNFINVPFDPAELFERSIPSLTSFGIDDDSFVIGTVTRLEKPYLKGFIEGCVTLAKRNFQKKITLIVAGGSEDGNILGRLKETFNSNVLNIPNLHIVFTGYIAELGKDFFNLLDVFVGQGTASINAISQGCATLNMDPNTNQCSGIFGIDVDNFAYPKNGNVYKVEDKLESFIIDNTILKYAQMKGEELFNNQYSIENCFNKMDKLIAISNSQSLYYSFNISVYNRIKDKLKFYELALKLKFHNLILYLRKK